MVPVDLHAIIRVTSKSKGFKFLQLVSKPNLSLIMLVNCKFGDQWKKAKFALNVTKTTQIWDFNFGLMKSKIDIEGFWRSFDSKSIEPNILRIDEELREN